MQVTLDIPDVLAGSATDTEKLSRKVREALAIEGYLSGALTRGQVAESLNLSFHETEAWFVSKGVHRNYGTEELDSDRGTLDRLLAGE